MMAAGSTYPAAPPTERPTNPSCFGSLEHVTLTVVAVRNRVEEIVARMAGSYPDPAGNAKGEIRPAPNGLLEQAQSNVSSISDSMEVINEALSRLERSLP